MPYPRLPRQDKPGFLKQAFRWAVRAALVPPVAAILYTSAFYVGQGRKLTPNEKHKLEFFYGGDFDAGRVRIHNRDKNSIPYYVVKTFIGDKSAAVSPPMSHIDFFDPSLYSSDYSADTSLRKFRYFMHESMHAYENQHCMWDLKDARRYEYAIVAGKSFWDYGYEQKAAIIEDYAGLFLHATQSGRPFYNIGPSKGTPAEDEEIRKVVEGALPNAAKWRRSLGR